MLPNIPNPLPVGLWLKGLWTRLHRMDAEPLNPLPASRIRSLLVGPWLMGSYALMVAVLPNPWLAYGAMWLVGSLARLHGWLPSPESVACVPYDSWARGPVCFDCC